MCNITRHQLGNDVTNGMGNMRITIRNVFNTNDVEELASEIEMELKKLGKIKKSVKTDDGLNFIFYHRETRLVKSSLKLVQSKAEDKIKAIIEADVENVRTKLYWIMVIILAFLTLGFAIGYVVFDQIFRPSSEKLSQNAERIFNLAFENVGDRVNSAF